VPPCVTYPNPTFSGTRFTKRFRRWAKSGHWQSIFEALQDLDWTMLDSTTVRAHHQAAGIPCWAKKKHRSGRALGRSRGGLTTKIHAVFDALGNPLRVALTPGQWADSPQALALLEILDCGFKLLMLEQFFGTIHCERIESCIIYIMLNKTIYTTIT